MTTVEQPQIQQDFDLLNDDHQEAAKTSPSHLVVDTNLKQAQAQGVPASASTAGTVQTAQTQSTKIVEKVVAVPTVAEARHELLNLHDKVDHALGHHRSYSSVSLHRISHYEPYYETEKKSYALTQVHTSGDSVHSAELKARAVARAKEYMLEVNGGKKSPAHLRTSSVSSSSYLYSKPVEVSTSVSSLYRSSYLTSTPKVTVYTATRVQLPLSSTYSSYKPAVYSPPTYKVSYGTYDGLRTSSVRSEKVKSAGVKVVEDKCHACGHELVEKCHACGHELPKKQKEEREVRSSAPKQEVEEVSVRRSLGKRREILDERQKRQNSAQRY